MRTRMSTLVATGLLVSCGGTGDAVDVPDADLVLTNGRIVTVDERRPRAEALAVRDGRIQALGSSDEIRAYVGEGTEVIDLEGRPAYPGFIETHGHFVGLGDAKMILDLTTASSWEEIVGMVAEAVARAGPGEWIRGRGWHQEKWDSLPDATVDGVPLHDALSAASPDNPVHLEHASGHASFANANAMALAGIDGDTPDPAGGTIVEDARGLPTGLLRETAQGLVEAAIARSRNDMTGEELDAEFRRQVELAGREALAHGVTTFHDAGSDFATIERFTDLADEGALPVRLYVMVRYESNADMAEHLERYRKVGYGEGFLTVRSIKRQIDGALGSHGAWLLEPYVDLPESRGLVLETVEEIEETARIALANDYQVNTHAIGDRANREVLDLYERAFAAAGVDGEGLRWRIEHAQHLHPADVPRFAEMGVVAAVQGVHATSDGPWIPERLGERRTREGAYVWRDLIDAGVVLSNGTDVPVERIDPIASYYASVSRTMSDGEAFHPAQAMTRQEALESYTINGAYAGFEEDMKGSLVPGKMADIVVLSQDILTVPEAEIPSTVVEMTILGGEVRFRR